MMNVLCIFVLQHMLRVCHFYGLFKILDCWQTFLSHHYMDPNIALLTVS